MPFLRRSVILLSLLLSFSLVSNAQTAPAEPLLKPQEVTDNYKKYLYKRYAGNEQATQVINLFAKRQTGGALWVGSGVAVIGLVASQTGSKSDGNGGTTTFTVTPLGWGVLLGLFGGVGIGKLARFSNEKLYQAFVEYDKNQAFPVAIQEKLL